MSTLEDILVTEELDRRPNRAPDYESEARAFSLLAAEISDNPDAVLQKLADLIVELGLADSSGISLLEHENGTFRWPAVSGEWAHLVEGRMPIDASPCGVVLARNQPLLFQEPHLHFPAAHRDPLIQEILLVPFHIAGAPAGTIWAIAHQATRKFQREDVRVLSSLARFASAAVQAVHARQVAEAARDLEAAGRMKADARLAIELSDARTLQDLSSSLIDAHETQILHDRIVDSALHLMKADAASLQILDPEGRDLQLAAARNFDADSQRFWQTVSTRSGSACGRALRLGHRVLIPDIEGDAEMAGTADLAQLRHLGMRAVQSTPLATFSGKQIGMISTLWKEPNRPTRENFALLDVLARQTAELIDRSRSEAALRESEARYRLLFESIDEGFCIIEMLFDAAGEPCDYRFLQVNPAFERQTGLSAALGKRMRELAPAHEQSWFDIYGRIARTGIPERFEQRAEALGHWYEVFAFRVGKPEENHVAILFKDILQRKLAEQALRAREERQAFLLRLSDEMRGQADCASMARAALDLLAEQLCLDRAYIATVETGKDLATVSWQYHRAALPPVPRELRPSDFPSVLRRAQKGGLVVTDAASDPDLAERDRAALQAIGLSGFIVAPVRKDGRDLAWALVAASAEPRSWTPNEIALLQDAAERIWDALERSRAETARRDSEERFRQFGEAAQDVLWIRDARSLQWEYLTPAFETIYGRDRGQVLGGDELINWADQIHAEDRDEAVALLRRAAQGEKLTFEYRIIRASDGAQRWLRTTAFPMRDGSGEVERIGGIGRDITHLKKAEAALAAAESRQRALLEGIAQLIWRANEGGQWTWSSPQWSEYTGLSIEESAGLGWLEAFHPEDRVAAMTLWDEAEDSGRFEFEGRIRDARRLSYRWFATRALPVRDATGAVVEWLGTSTDIDELRNLQDQQNVLVAELQHRTRNLLAVVRSVAEKTAQNTTDMDDFRDRFRDRLDALSRVQGLLSRLKEHDRVTFDQLIATELAAMDGTSRKITTFGPTGVRLRSSIVQTLAMALHELATNAVKYGALGQPDGSLRIAWTHEPSGEGDQPWLHVDWREKGVRMGAEPCPTRGSGQGRELIERALPYQLNARTSFQLGPEGVHCTISIPLSGKPPYRP